ncbi:MAG: DUF58 domain-containing protein [Aeromicrobium sp.]
MTFDTQSRITRTVAATGTATHTRYTTRRGDTIVTAVVWWIRAWRFVSSRAVAATEWVRDTVTPAGWLAVGLALLLPLGIVFGWAEVIIAASVALVLLLIGIPFLFGARAYEVDLSLTHERVVAGTEVGGAVTITNVSKRIALPGRVDIPTGGGLTDVHVPLLRAGHTHVEQVNIAAHRRGVIRVGPVTSVRADPIGLLKREVAWAEVNELFVHPVTAPMPSTSAGFIKDLEGNPSAEIVDSDISFHAIRQYVLGDQRRNIHWKSTAKTGQLMVRQYEETRRSRLAIVLSLDETEYANEDEFELAVSAAGSLGVRALRDGRDLAVVASEEIPEFVRKVVRSIRSLSVRSTRGLLDDLSGVESAPNVMEVEQVCTLASQVLTDLSIAFVVVGSQMTPRRLQTIAARFPANVSVVAVVCDTSAQPSYRELSGIRVMTVAILEDFTGLMARAAA